MQVGWKACAWRSRVAGRARTIGNRVYPKRVSRVQIPPSPPNKNRPFSPNKGKRVTFFGKNNLVCLARSCSPFFRYNLPIVSAYARIFLNFLKRNENQWHDKGSQRIKNKHLKGFPNRGGPGGVRKEIRDGLTAGGILHIIILFYPLGRAVYEAFFGGSLL